MKDRGRKKEPGISDEEGRGNWYDGEWIDGMGQSVVEEFEASDGCTGGSGESSNG